MNCLIIEDDPSKSNKIVSFINELFPDINVLLSLSYKSGLEKIFNMSFDFILLDMSLPTYDPNSGKNIGRPRNFGGRDILKEMKRYKKKSKVKIVTQYNEFDGGSIGIEELHEQLLNSYSDIYCGYIYYNSKQSEWKKKLSDFIGEISE